MRAATREDGEALNHCARSNVSATGAWVVGMWVVGGGEVEVL